MNSSLLHRNLFPEHFAECSRREECHRKLGKCVIHAVEFLAIVGGLVVATYFGANYLDDRQNQFLNNQVQQSQYGEMPSLDSTIVDGIDEIVLP